MVSSVPQAMISVSQSSEGSVSGLNHTLTCVATVVNGVSPSLVMVNWDREETATIVSSNDGLQYTRMISYSPILSRDRGQYTCSVSVTGFSEADNSDTIMVIVNGKQILYLCIVCQKAKVTEDSHWSRVSTQEHSA